MNKLAQKWLRIKSNGKITVHYYRSHASSCLSLLEPKSRFLNIQKKKIIKITIKWYKKPSKYLLQINHLQHSFLFIQWEFHANSVISSTFFFSLRVYHFFHHISELLFFSFIIITRFKVYWNFHFSPQNNIHLPFLSA